MKKKLKMKIKMKTNGKMGDRAAPWTLSPGEIYDTEVQCSKCGTRLYVSPQGATLVLESLSRTGVAGLICLCGHTEFIDAALRPLMLSVQKHHHG